MIDAEVLDIGLSRGCSSCVGGMIKGYQAMYGSHLGCDEGRKEKDRRRAQINLWMPCSQAIQVLIIDPSVFLWSYMLQICWLSNLHLAGSEFLCFVFPLIVPFVLSQCMVRQVMEAVLKHFPQEAMIYENVPRSVAIHKLEVENGLLELLLG